VRTLFGFGGGFGALDRFLKLLLKGFWEKLASLDKEEGFHVVEGFAVGGIVGDEIALVEQSFELRKEKLAGMGAAGNEGHRIRPGKKVDRCSVDKIPQNLHTPWGISRAL